MQQSHSFLTKCIAEQRVNKKNVHHKPFYALLQSPEQPLGNRVEGGSQMLRWRAKSRCTSMGGSNLKYILLGV